MRTPPQPVPTKVVCSACGLDWELHEDKIKETQQPAVNLETCVLLLVAALSQRKFSSAIGTATSTAPSWLEYQ